MIQDSKKVLSSTGCAFFLLYIPLAIIVFLVFLVVATKKGDITLISPETGGLKRILVFTLVIDFFICIISGISEYNKSAREHIISYQYSKDSTSICPRCGSHDISLGRKGYDWSKGFGIVFLTSGRVATLQEWIAERLLVIATTVRTVGKAAKNG